MLRLQKKYLTEKHKSTLSKREQIANLLKKMARQMSFPKETIDALNGLDLTIATDKEVDLILNHLTALIEDMEKEKARTGLDIKTAISIHKINNN